MARFSQKLSKEERSAARQSYFREFLRYFVRIWRRRQSPPSRFTAIMHNINRTAVLVFIVGLLFFVLRRLFFV